MPYKDILMVFIVGASGSGKTSVVHELERLYADELRTFYFDDIGVPAVDEMIARHGSCQNWQQWATEQWIERLLAQDEKRVVILEGSFNPAFAIARLKNLGIKKYLFICIHVDQKIREQRLIELRNQPELITEDMESFAQFLKQKTKDVGGIIINGTHASIEQIAHAVYIHIKKLLAPK